MPLAACPPVHGSVETTSKHWQASCQWHPALWSFSHYAALNRPIRVTIIHRRQPPRLGPAAYATFAYSMDSHGVKSSSAEPSFLRSVAVGRRIVAGGRFAPDPKVASGQEAGLSPAGGQFADRSTLCAMVFWRRHYALAARTVRSHGVLQAWHHQRRPDFLRPHHSQHADSGPMVLRVGLPFGRAAGSLTLAVGEAEDQAQAGADRPAGDGASHCLHVHVRRPGCVASREQDSHGRARSAVDDHGFLGDLSKGVAAHRSDVSGLRLRDHLFHGLEGLL